MPHKTLVEFGLNEKEAKVYLALLELGAAGASDIAAKTKINRSSVYVAVESLKAMGFVTAIVKTNPNNGVTIQEFIAASPDALLSAAHGRAQNERELEYKIEAMVPELKALNKRLKHIPKIYVCERQQTVDLGMFGLFEEQTARGMKKFRFYGDASLLSGLRSRFADSYSKAPAAPMKKAAIALRVVSPGTPEAQIAAEEYRHNGSKDEFAFVPPTEFNPFLYDLPALAIYEDKVGFFLKDSSFVVLENKEMADVLKNIFDMAIEQSLA